MPKKLLILFLIISLFLTLNLGFLTTKKADAIPVEETFSTNYLLDSIAILLWKGLVYPLIRDQIINFVTTGDFKISWNSIKNWLLYELPTQTANIILKKYIGLDLCTTISKDVRFALGQMYANPSWEPSCTYDQSKLAQMTVKLFTGDSQGAWQDMKKNYYPKFYLSILGEGNQFGKWFQLRDNIDSQINKREQNIKFEMLLNEGFLAGYDCTGVPEEKRPDGCRPKTTGMLVSEVIRTSISSQIEAPLQATMVADLASVVGTVVDIYKNKMFTSVLNK